MRLLRQYDATKVSRLSNCWSNFAVRTQTPSPFQVRRVDVLIGSSYSLKGPSFVDADGFQNGLRSTLRSFDDSSDAVVSITQKLREYIDLHRVAHDEILLTFIPYVPRERNIHFRCIWCSFRVTVPPEFEAGREHSTTLQLRWSTQWAPNTYQAGEKSSLEINSYHTIKASDLRYPQYLHQRDSTRYGWPIWGDAGKAQFSAVHPLNHYHRTIFELWLMDKDRGFKCVNEVLPTALKLSEKAPSGLRPTALQMGLNHQPLSDKAEPRPMNEILHKSTAILSLQDYRKWFQGERVSKAQVTGSKAYIALGSNEGDSLASLEKACRAMAEVGIVVERTSGLYETSPMYLTEQSCFLNAVCEVTTSLDAHELLERLKVIESEFGRVKTIDNGPRPIDLDILLYKDEAINSASLTVPHPRMMEREFVLRPLCDLIPKATLSETAPLLTFMDSLDKLTKNAPSFYSQTQVSSRMPPIINQSPSKPTRVMSVLNLTPDSFSDGGFHSIVNTDATLQRLRQQLNQKRPSNILDIGGLSTRPKPAKGSPPELISAEEEIARILPTIKAVRADSSFDKLTISVDTYRASVAEAAIKAGADLVNDVSAGRMDPYMLSTIAKIGCSCILMHMRGTPNNMTQAKHTSYPNGVIETIGKELLERVQEAEKAGIRRWRIVLDPGIGFAKNQEHNLEILRRFEELRNFEGLQGFSWVIGASRKKFIGHITGVAEANQRQYGTAACVAAAVQGGADIVRVHDVEEMSQVAAMADAIWRV